MSLHVVDELFGDEIKAVAQELSGRLPLTAPQLRQAFNDDELKELQALIDEVEKAADENEKVARIQEKAGSVLKLFTKLGVFL